MRTVAPLLASCAVGLVLTACGSEEPVTTEGATPMPTSSAARPEADFTADVAVADDVVTVTWSLTNTGAVPLGVLDRVPSGSSGSAVDFDSGAAWVVADGDDRVQLGQQVLARPEADGVARETTPVTGATLLEPGTTLEGTATVPRPFVGFHPYGEDPSDPELVLPADPVDVRFCLGVLADTSVLYETPRGVLVADDQEANVALQYLFCSDPAAL